MAKTIRAKVLKTEIEEDGQVHIRVELVDPKGHKWNKTYSYYTTQVISAESFKKRIAADLKKDLQVADQLKEITPIIGKEFPVTI